MAQEIYHRSEWGNPNEQWGNVYLNADLTNELYKRASEYENSWVTDQLLNGVGTKPSIIMTPTAYEDGLLNSVKPAKTFGSELVTNGTFDTDSNWTKGGGATISNGKGNIIGDGTSFTNLQQSNVLTVGKFYKVTLDAVINSGLGLKVQDGSTNENFGAITTSGKYTFYGKANNANLVIGRRTGGIAFDSYVDNVSVKEVIDADFDFTRGSSATRVNEKGLIQDVQILSDELVQNGNFEQIGSEQVTNGGFDENINGWVDYLSTSSWDNGSIKSTVTTNVAYIRQNRVVTANKFYKVTFKAKSTNISQNIRIFNGTTFVDTSLSFDEVNTYKDFTYYLYTTVSQIIIGQTGLSVGDAVNFDNVSVKEVGQDWEFSSQSEFTEQGARVYSSDGSYQYIVQNNILTIGKQYKITFDVISTNGASLASGTGAFIYDTSTTGSKTFYINADDAGLGLKRLSGVTDVTIDNISVKEVGQNWSFGSGWSMGDGKAVRTSTNSTALSQSFSALQNKKFRLSFEVSDWTVGHLKGYFYGGGGSDEFFDNTSIGNGSFTFEVTTTTNRTNFAFLAFGSFDGSIDNVSLIEITNDTDLPRINYTNFDYENGEVVPYSGEGSLLLENQSTNLVTYSEDFTQWTNNTTNLDVPSNVTQTNPSGGNESGFININNGVSASKFIYDPISTTSSIHTQSVFFKYHSRQWIQLASGGTSHYANFDIQNGVVGNVSGCTATIEYYGGGWYKCTATLTSAATPINLAIVVVDDDATSRIPTSTETGSYYMWAAQTEALSYATSYIPTEGSIKTRLADICNNAGSSDLINSTEGVLYAEVSALSNTADSSAFITISDGTYNNRASILFSNGSINQIRTFLRVGGVSQIDGSENVTDVTDFNKVAFSYKENDFKVYINGSLASSNTSGSVWSADTITKLSFSEINTSAGLFNGNVKTVAVFKEALSDEELQKLTTI